MEKNSILEAHILYDTSKQECIRQYGTALSLQHSQQSETGLFFEPNESSAQVD